MFPRVEVFGFRLCYCRSVLLGFCLWTSLLMELRFSYFLFIISKISGQCCFMSRLGSLFVIAFDFKGKQFEEKFPRAKM